MRALALVLAACAVLAAARGLVRHNTWYLASDQFAFLTFADDLAHGRVFHDPTIVGLMAGPSLPHDAAADAYYQTYIYRDGRLYSRYPPGYPLLLAATGLVAGETAVHWLNPLLYLVLLVVLGRLAGRMARTGQAWATAAATMWALLVIPVEVHYWGITVARDLPAHLLALVAILRALSGRPVSTGFLLGLATSIRPDAILWAPSVGLVLGAHERLRPRAILEGSAAFAVGVLPLFAYNTATQGHPLAFTQGSEFRGMFQSALGLPALAGAGASFVSGGAFRLVHFPETFTAHLRYLVSAFGMFLWLALCMLLVAVRRRLPLARALGPYVVIGLLFYSCWSHGDPRYLVGVSLSLIVLTGAALVRIAARLADTFTPLARRLIALAAFGGVLAIGTPSALGPARDLNALERTSALALVAAAATAAVRPLRGLAPLAPAIAFAVFGAVRIATSAAPGDGFGAGDIARARAEIESLVPAGAFVLMTPGLGRPAENWTHYTHAEAHYTAELGRLFSNPNSVGLRCTTTGRPFFVLLRATEPPPFAVPAAWIRTREIARRSGEALRDWFIDPERAPEGVVLREVWITITPPGS